MLQNPSRREEIVMKSTSDKAIGSINGYLELLSNEQIQEVFSFTQTLFITMILKKISYLPANKQWEVLDFTEYLIERMAD